MPKACPYNVAGTRMKNLYPADIFPQNSESILYAKVWHI